MVLITAGKMNASPIPVPPKINNVRRLNLSAIARKINDDNTKINPSIPVAFGTWWSFIAFGTGDTHHLALVYATRLYAYLLLGAAVTLTVKVKDLLFSLNQHAKLSNTFTYGLLAAFNLVPRVRRQVQIIRYAGALRGITYHLWQPQIYFKAILSALHWSDDLAIAMTSHGFSEGFPRTQTLQEHLPKWQWGLAFLLVLAYFIVAIVIKPW